MKSILPFLLLACLSDAWCASDTPYDWVLQQYSNKDPSEIAAQTEGRIDGAQYVAIIARRTSPTSSDGPVILIFRGPLDRPAVVATIDLQGDYAGGYSVAMKNDSIYLEHWVGHHGWHGGRYQFKQVDNAFRLIGAEYQAQQLGCYAGDESPKCSTREVWSGASYNFLTSSAICWQQTISLRNERSISEAGRRSERWLQPKGGVRHQMPFRPINRPSLDGFNFLAFSLPNACYFDHKNKLQLEHREP